MLSSSHQIISDRARAARRSTSGSQPELLAHSLAMAPTPPPAAAAGAAQSGAHTVFVYGSLMEEAVVRAILKRAPPAAPAILPDLYAPPPSSPHLSRLVVILDSLWAVAFVSPPQDSVSGWRWRV